jgi:hypothetical protein
MGTHRPPYCRQHANNIRWQAPHRPHTHNSATLKVHFQFPFRFGCNPLTLSSFRNPEIHNLHPEGICFWQTELKRWQCHHARFQDSREGASRCLQTVAHCWMVTSGWCVLTASPRHLPQLTVECGHYTSTLVVSTHRGSPAAASPLSGFAVVRVQPCK